MTTISKKNAYKTHASEYREVSRRSAIEGASPHKLTEMLMEGALKQIFLAQIAIDKNDIEGRGKSINKALAIITELRETIDLDNGGSIAENLMNLYMFMEGQLFDAHSRENKEALQNTASLMSEILDAWKAIR